MSTRKTTTAAHAATARSAHDRADEPLSLVEKIAWIDGVLQRDIEQIKAYAGMVQASLAVRAQYEKQRSRQQEAH